MMFNRNSWISKGFLVTASLLLSAPVGLADVSQDDPGKQKIEELKKLRQAGRSEDLFRQIFAIYGPDHLAVADELIAAGFTCVRSSNLRENDQADIRCSFVRCNKIYRWNWKDTTVEVVFRDGIRRISAGTVNYAWVCPGPIKRKKLQRFNLEQEETGWVEYSGKK